MHVKVPFSRPRGTQKVAAMNLLTRAQSNWRLFYFAVIKIG